MSRTSGQTEFACIVIPANDDIETRSPSPSPTTDRLISTPDSNPRGSSLSLEQPIWDMIPSCAPFVEYIFDGFTNLDAEQQQYLLNIVTSIQNEPSDTTIRSTTSQTPPEPQDSNRDKDERQQDLPRTLERDGTYGMRVTEREREMLGQLSSGHKGGGYYECDFDRWDRMWGDLMEHSWG